MNGGVHNEAFCGHSFDTRSRVRPVGDGVCCQHVTSPEKGNTDATVTPDKGNTDANGTPNKGNTSPQTGESFSILWVILAAIAAIGAVLFCGKKLIRVK